MKTYRQKMDDFLRVYQMARGGRHFLSVNVSIWLVLGDVRVSPLVVMVGVGSTVKSHISQELYQK